MRLSHLKYRLETVLEKTGLKKLFKTELIRFGIWGAATSLLNVGVFQLALMLGLNYLAANAVALVLAKTAAYLTSKFFVFHHRCATKRELVVEIFRFIYTRGATMLFDFFGLMLLVEAFHADELLSKCVVTVLVILANYFLGKFHVFRNDDFAVPSAPEKQDESEEPL